MAAAKFLIEYLRSPRTVGAVAPSSKKLAEKMVRDIDFDKAECIVEYGPGTGVFTDKLVEGKRRDTKLLLIENNKEFFSQLKEKYNRSDNVILVNGSAENVDEYLNDYNIRKVDYVVSGLPFTSLPKKVADRILEKTQKILNKDGLFITFQYTHIKKKFIASYFGRIDSKMVVLNVPPAFVFTCQNC